MKILELGGEGGSVYILEKFADGKPVYYLNTEEYIDDDELSNDSEQRQSPEAAWKALTKKYRVWYWLYPLHVSESLLPLVRKSLMEISDAERFNRDVWERL